MRKMLCLANIVLIFSFLSCSNLRKMDAAFLSITNDCFWDTADGEPLYSQGGGIFKFTDPISGQEKYYWYGAKYREAELYRQDPTVTQVRDHFQSVTCYSSTDLVNWHFEADVLTRKELNMDRFPTWAGRLGVAYMDTIKKYVMFIQHGNRVLVATSDTPTGNFVQHRHIDMTERIGTSNTGDQTVFTDEDTGKSYLVYSYGQGRNKIYVSEIGWRDGKIDLLNCVQVFKGASREGNCLFKYKGKYYMCASNIYGWDASYAYYLVADDIFGPYQPLDDMQVMTGCEDDYAHVTQTGFFYTLRGSKHETVIYCGDRWAEFAGNGLGYNQWFPLSFDGVEQKTRFNSMSHWALNPVTGEWRVGERNNYILNPSFEADRVAIPSNKKPVQEQLKGWTSEVIKGNRIATFDVSSPQLNYFNSQQDRLSVVGEKALSLYDKIPFERRVFQKVKSRPEIPLNDGYYHLSAMVRTVGELKVAQMYADAETIDIHDTNGQWLRVERTISVKNGSVEIGFRAASESGGRLLVDDVVLVKNDK